MASTYSPSLRIELIGAGEQAGTWNTTTNSNLGTLIESAIAGYVSVSVTSANQAFTALDGAPDQARNAVIALSTTTGANFNVYAPPQEKTYIIYNTTAYIATIYNSTVLGNTTAAGLGVAVAAGGKVVMFSDGTNFRSVDATSFSGVLPVANGGTGVSTSTGTGNTVLSTSPTLVTPILGTPTSGTLDNCTSNTETFGTSNTQLATTAFVQAALAALHPVGSIYTATVSTNPATLLGFGTWTAFGAGRVLIGDGGGFSAGATGGAADAVVVSHTHTASTGSAGSATGSITTGNPGDFGALRDAGTGVLAGTSSNGNRPQGSAGGGSLSTLSISIPDHTHTVTVNSAGVSSTNANLQPYVVVYMWNRTA
jgi:hypothetical protein